MKTQLNGLFNNKLTKLETALILFVMIEPVASIPQIAKIYVTKSAEDFFVWTWVGGFAVNTAWLFYALKIKKGPILISAIVWMMIHASMAMGIILYR